MGYLSHLNFASISSNAAGFSHVPEAEEQEMSGQFSKRVPGAQTAIH